MITLSSLQSLPGIRHGFMTRAGGVSEGIYASLNCGLGSDDDLERVRENRRRVLRLVDIPATTLLSFFVSTLSWKLSPTTALGSTMFSRK